MEQEFEGEDFIHFYSTHGKYGCFSNFSRHAVWLKDKRWPTSEHYFQVRFIHDSKY
jgi:predicted NAD-dependent protein-ADP-ribosyltransferase YbiA (DUF1768 family)